MDNCIYIAIIFAVWAIIMTVLVVIAVDTISELRIQLKIARQFPQEKSL